MEEDEIVLILIAKWWSRTGEENNPAHNRPEVEKLNPGFPVMAFTVEKYGLEAKRKDQAQFHYSLRVPKTE